MAARFLIVAALTAAASAGSIRDIKHVVLFMQENRAFDHVCTAEKVEKLAI